MIEVHIDLQAVDVVHMDGFPENPKPPETLYDEMVIILWGFERPTLTRRYLVAIGLYLSDSFVSDSWRVVAFIGQVEVGRMEYILPGEGPVTPRIEKAQRVSRYERKPVI